MILMLSVVPAAIEQGVSLYKSKAKISQKAGNWIETGLLRMENVVKPFISSDEVEPAETGQPGWGDFAVNVVESEDELPEDGSKQIHISFPSHLQGTGNDDHLAIRVFDDTGKRWEADGAELAESKPTQLLELRALVDQYQESPRCGRLP